MNRAAMNDKQARELEALREMQRDLRWRLDAMERRIENLAKADAAQVPAVPSDAGARPSVIPPPVPAPGESASGPATHPPELPLPRPIPRFSGKPPVSSGDFEPADDLLVPAVAGDVLPRAMNSSVPETSSPLPPKTETFEMHFGRVWLVRIGVVVLLTGLVFLGNFAWQEVISRIGAGGKLLMLVLAGAGLAGLGAYLGRRSSALLGYGRVLIGAGLATIYYAAYGAHFVDPLRVIANPLIGGILLLGLAGAILWIATWMRSQAVASVTVVLGFYTAAINPVSGFSLFSNLILSVLAIVLLVRRSWISVSFLSLVGSYAAYGFWRMHGGGGSSDFSAALLFPISYWVVFTVATFLGRGDVFGIAARSVFLTLNNGACFALTAPVVAAKHPDFLWLYALGAGVVLIALGLVAAKRERSESALDGSYLVQGLALFFLGLLFKLSGYQIAYVFALQSGTLLMLSRLRHRKILQIFAAISATVAAFWAGRELMNDHPHAAFTCGGVALILIGVSWQFKRQRGWLFPPKFHWRTGGYIMLSTLLGIAAALHAMEGNGQWTLLMVLAVIATASIYVLRMPEVVIGGQLFAIAGGIAWLVDAPAGHSPVPVWAGMMIFTVSLMHWWQRPGRFPFAASLQQAMTGVYALIAVATTFVWIGERFDSSAWIYAVAALGFLGYGILTRVLPLVVAGQAFSVAFVPAFFAAISEGDPWPPTTGALAVFASQSLILRLGAARLGESIRSTLARYTHVLSGMSVFLGLLAVVTYVPDRWQFVVFSAICAGFTAAAWPTRRIDLLIYSGVVLLVAAWKFLDRNSGSDPVALMDFPGLILLLIAREIAVRALAGRVPLPNWFWPALTAVLLGGLWMWVGRAAEFLSDGIWMTISWALLAFTTLGVGFLIRDRTYRLCGLAILATSVVRVFLVDVWEFETVFRILSFLVLGVVLLGLGFLYNRLAEALRKWM